MARRIGTERLRKLFVVIRPTSKDLELTKSMALIPF